MEVFICKTFSFINLGSPADTLTTWSALSDRAGYSLAYISGKYILYRKCAHDDRRKQDKQSTLKLFFFIFTFQNLKVNEHSLGWLKFFKQATKKQGRVVQSLVKITQG